MNYYWKVLFVNNKLVIMIMAWEFDNSNNCVHFKIVSTVNSSLGYTYKWICVNPCWGEFTLGGTVHIHTGVVQMCLVWHFTCRIPREFFFFFFCFIIFLWTFSRIWRATVNNPRKTCLNSQISSKITLYSKQNYWKYVLG